MIAPAWAVEFVGPHTLLLSGDGAPLCLNSAVRAAGAPCAYSSRTNGRRLQWGRAISNVVGRLFRLRVRAMAPVSYTHLTLPTKA